MPYKVESFHLNVGAGDGAIHLLTSDPAVPGTKRMVQQAFLIDGGTSGNVYLINELIVYIEINYLDKDGNAFETANPLKFDSFVITHWDGDHYGGLEAWLLSDIGMDDTLNRAKYDGDTPKSYIYSPCKWESKSSFCVTNNMLRRKRSTENLLQVVTTWESLLGRNLFTEGPTNRAPANPTSINSLQMLLGTSNTVKAPSSGVNYTDSIPALYCVAAERHVLGSAEIKATLTETNMSSIILLLVWKLGDGSHRVSHYLAGDAHAKLEAAVGEWMGAYKPTSMKLSHHGSASSNPEKNFERWLPKNIIVSAGGQHGHPRWEVIMFISSLWGTQPSRKPLFPCQYPYYLAKESNGKFKKSRISLAALNDDEDKEGSFLNTMSRLLKVSKKIRKDKGMLLAAVRNLKNLKKQQSEKADAWKKRLFEDVLKVLPQLTDMGVGGFNYPSIVQGGAPTMQTIWATLCIKVESVGAANRDGDITVISQKSFFTRSFTTISVPVGLNSTVMMQQPFPSQSSKALCMAMMEDGEDMVEVEPFPYPGVDRLRIFDLTEGNPKWQDVLAEDLPSSSLADDSKLFSHANFEPGYDDLSEDSEWDMMDYTFSKTPTPQAPLVRFQQLPSHVYVPKIYIACASKEKDGGPIRLPTGSQACILKADHSLYGFVDTLHLRGFGLTGVPDNLNPTPIDQDDEIYQWLGNFCGWGDSIEGGSQVPPGFSLSLSKTDKWKGDSVADKDLKLDFEMKVPLFKNKAILTFSTNKGATDTFSKVKEKTGESGKSVAPEALRNMLVNRRTLVLGLEDLPEDKFIETSLRDFARFIRLDVDRYPVLLFFANELALTLDTKEDLRNAVWFRPSLQYEAQMRLQFHVDLDRFNKWLHTFNASLNVESVLLIGRKKASWLWEVPKDMMNFQSSISFLCRVKISSKVLVQGVFDLEEELVKLTLTLDRATVLKGKSLEAMQGSDDILYEVMGWLDDKFKMSGSEELRGLLEKATESETGIIQGDSILPRRIQLALDIDANGNIQRVRNASVEIEACLNIGRSEVAIAAKQPIVFLFSLYWNRGGGFRLNGKLWTVIPENPFATYDRALPEFEEYQILKPVARGFSEDTQLRTIDLSRLLSTNEGEVTNLPLGIPNEIWKCEIEISKNSVSFSGGLRCSAPTQTTLLEPAPPMPPMISLESINLDASYTWGTTSPSQSGFSLRLDIALSLYLGGGLQDAKDDYDDPELQYGSAAQLYGQVLYDKGKWQITASVYDLSISHLLCFWDLEDRDSILQYFGKINIEYVKIKYEFNRKEGSNPKIPSRLLVEGQFEIDSVATLTMTYENEGGDDWGFTAGLRPSDKTGDNATIGKLLSSFLDAELVLILPKAIKDADIAKGKGDEALRILCCKRDGLSIFACLVKIGNVSVWFVQLRQGKDGPVKRMLKASISKISVEVSAFQTTISSPWEDLFFMWVQDTTSTEGNGSNKAGTPGITKQEYDIMVEILKDKAHVTDDQLHLFKPRGNESVSEDPALSSWVTEDDDIPDPAQKETVIAAGSHLVVVTKTLKGTSEVILDHLFGVKKQKSKGSGASFDHQSQHEQKSLPKYANAIAPAPKNSKQPDPSGSEKGVKAPLKAKVGPLSVSNVGLWFKDGMIGVTLDATLIMGPLGLSLLGFTIGVPFGEQYSLANPPPPTAIEWGLQGLILAMDKPPLTIAGGFMRDTSNENVEVMYTGGLVVGFKPWSFEAMGAYATVYKTETNSGEWITTIDTKPLNQYSLLSLQEDRESTHCQELEDGKRETFTFSFIYVKMNGPLFSVGFADVAGLVGGFGINSDITLPTVEQVIQFPFVAERDSSTESSPVQRMQELMEGPWFRPAEGLYWAAAGARVTAFQMFAANIVLVLQFGNGNLLFGIFGVATCDVPSLQAPVKFAHVELGIVCTFDVNSGIFKFEAQLSPRSFVLAPQCHLTGGMALFSWTKDELSDPKNKISGGDWVLTIGGYHRAFLPPKQYPKPPRLGISWSLSSCLSVKGEAYFAITPKVCMGGGRIRAAMSVGLLYAWFDAFMDFLMNFDPFYFQMTARVSVGVRFTLDLWLVTIRISVEIGAGLDLMGPPFGGVVHVDFWVFGFDIKFGASPRAPSAIDLDRFFKVATKTSSSSSASSRGLLVDRHNETSHSQANAQPDTAAILLTCETGLLPPLQDMKKKPVTPCVDDSELDNGKWYVKGANFSLNASFQIPITTARLTEKRTEILSGGKKQEETRYTDCNIAEQYQKVYAKPMQLYDPLTSVVSISVKAPEPKKKKTQDIHIFEDWKDQKWKLTAQVKPVQSSIWGQYNRNLDPSQVKGPIEGLLNGDNATMKLVTGISIVPPDPAMAGDKVNKFNVTKDHMASVFDSEKDEWPLFIGVTKMQEPAWQPKQRGKMWGDFRDNWNSIGDETTMKAVDLWAKRMRYDKESVDEGQKDENLKKTFNPLSGVAPKKLIRNYEQLVPALPLVAVGY